MFTHYSSHRGLISRFYNIGKPFDRGTSNLILRIVMNSHSSNSQKYMNKRSIGKQLGIAVKYSETLFYLEWLLANKQTKPQIGGAGDIGRKGGNLLWSN